MSKTKPNKTFPLMRSHGGLPTQVNKRRSPVDLPECFTLKLGGFSEVVLPGKPRGGLGRGCICLVFIFLLSKQAVWLINLSLNQSL